MFEIGGELWGSAMLMARATVVAQRCAWIIEKLIDLVRAAAGMAKTAAEAIAKVLEKVKSAVAEIARRDPTLRKLEEVAEHVVQGLGDAVSELIDQNAKKLIELTERALKDFDDGVIGMSGKQAERPKTDPRFFNTYKGQVLDWTVKEFVERNLAGVESTKQGPRGPDFVNITPKAGEAAWYDLATLRH